MYRRRGYREACRRREKFRANLQKILAGVSVVCIIIVCAAVAFRTRKATQTVEARTTFMQATTVSMKTDVIQAATATGKGGAVQAAVTDKRDATQAAKTEAEVSSDTVGDTGSREAGIQAESIIIIDPGHGGIDGGCVFDDIVEKDINRMIAVRVVTQLRNMGYEAELSRQGDEYIDKMERVENANAKNALVYVSIHQNSCEDHRVQGIETWYDGSDTARDSGRLARLIQQETVRNTGAVCRELVSESDLCVTSKSTMPACLIETGFLSNKEEREKLATKEYRDKIAAGIAGGIDLYLNPDSISADTDLERNETGTY